MKKIIVVLSMVLLCTTLSSCNDKKDNQKLEENVLKNEQTTATNPQEEVKSESDSSLKYSLGTKNRVDKVNGYAGTKTITDSDPHYGWDLGNFFVSGYTSYEKDSEGNLVFLKNVGDEITLWFNLKQDINCLNGDDTVLIEPDEDGFDQYFETKKTDFGRGALIIRFTNYENVKEDPVLYTNFLEADAKTGADTKVKTFEEGDYEVALDYKIKYDKGKVFGKSVLPGTSQYRIFFKFSVRNGNCMVYPFDTETGSELSNSSITPNGFYLDLARSRYLKINIRKEVLKEGADGLTEDTRFNRPAKDGDQYTDEGIYTITVQNIYTNQQTIKKIYVGTNEVLIAHMMTGLSIEDIKKEIDRGAVIQEDGTILFPEKEEEIKGSEKTEEQEEVEEQKEKESEGLFPFWPFN